MDASVPSPVHTTKGRALQKVSLLHYQTQVFMTLIQVQTSVLVGLGLYTTLPFWKAIYMSQIITYFHEETMLIMMVEKKLCVYFFCICLNLINSNIKGFGEWNIFWNKWEFIAIMYYLYILWIWIRSRSCTSCLIGRSFATKN